MRHTTTVVTTLSVTAAALGLASQGHAADFIGFFTGKELPQVKLSADLDVGGYPNLPTIEAQLDLPASTGPYSGSFGVDASFIAPFGTPPIEGACQITIDAIAPNQPVVVRIVAEAKALEETSECRIDAVLPFVEFSLASPALVSHWRIDWAARYETIDGEAGIGGLFVVVPGSAAAVPLPWNTDLAGLDAIGTVEGEFDEGVSSLPLVAAATLWQGFTPWIGGGTDWFNFGHGVLTVELRVRIGDAPIPEPADFNGDGVIDGADLGLLISAFGDASAAFDLDWSGVVDAGDIGLLLAAWSGAA